MSFFRIALATILSAVVSMPSSAYADAAACSSTFDGRRITIVVPYAAGGGYDTYARAFAPALANSTGLDVRIANLPTAGGFAALKRVADAPLDELVLLIESASGIISQGNVPVGADNWMSRLIPTGIIHTDSETWIVRKGIDLKNATRLIASVTSFDANILPIVLAAHILGINVKVVAGYDGSSADTAALLRGEADMTSISLTTALRATANGELSLGLVLSDGRRPNAPHADYLAGQGGLMWQRSQALPKEEREDRLKLAKTITTASSTVRTLFASADMEPKSLGCLRQVISTALKSEMFRDAAISQKRPIEPLDADQAAVVIHDMLDAFRVTTNYLEGHPELVRDARATH